MMLSLFLLSLYIVSLVYIFFFFFFQAEDGIRDYKVTGVQTCALPISLSATPSAARCCAIGDAAARTIAVTAMATVISRCMEPPGSDDLSRSHEEIGRASCRERV